MGDTKRKKWKQLVDDCLHSGQSAPVWCKANNINVHTLRYWIKKFKNENTPDLEDKTETPTTWVKVDTSQPKSEFIEEVLIISIGKASIKVNPNFDPKFLQDVVRTLSSIC